VDEADAARLPPRVTKSAKGNSPFAPQGFFKWVQQVRSHRDETRAEITRRRAVKEHGVHKSRLRKNLLSQPDQWVTIMSPCAAKQPSATSSQIMRICNK
jgi:hypothetical protein